jgi:hypothetical protein
MMLSDLAHARAGDKGDTSIIVVIPFVEADYEIVGRALALDALAEHFGVSPEQVTVIGAPKLTTYTVVITERLDGGVTRSRGNDPHGKSLSGHILDLRLETPGSL